MKVQRKQPTFDVFQFTNHDIEELADTLNVSARTEYDPTKKDVRYSIRDPKTGRWVTVHDGWFVVKEDGDLKFVFSKEQLEQQYDLVVDDE